MAIFIGVVIALVSICLFSYGFYKYKNRLPQPDYFDYYMTQDKVPEGKVGVLATMLILTENHSHAMFHNLVHKIFDQVVPWPFRKFAFMDKGVALMDPAHVHAREEFTPTHLEDSFGNDCDNDGYPWMEKYKKGKITWVRPSKMIYLDHGYFLYKGHPSGEPTTSGKMNNKSRLYYYDRGIVQKKIPHWEGTFNIL